MPRNLCKLHRIYQETTSLMKKVVALLFSLFGVFIGKAQ